MISTRRHLTAVSLLLLNCLLGHQAGAKPPQPPELREKIAQAQILALKSNDDEVRILAAAKLRTYTDALPGRAFLALRSAIADRLAAVRLEAVMGLARMLRTEQSARVKDVLEGTARRDQSRAVRMEAAAALRRLQPDLRGALRAAKIKHPGRFFWSVPGAPTARLRQVPRDAVPGLIRVLQRGKTPALRMGAAGALSKIDPLPRRAVLALVRALGDKDPLTGSAAAFALGSVEQLPKTALPRVLRASRAPYWKTRQGAVFILGGQKRPGTKTIAALIAALADETDYVASGAGCSLGDICRPRPAVCGKVEAALLTALQRGQLYTRRCAVYGLHQLRSRDPRQIPLLIRALGSRYGELRSAAVASLATLGPAARASAPALKRLLRREDIDRGSVKAALKSVTASGTSTPRPTP
jgi:HEAT repeat protein